MPLIKARSSSIVNDVDLRGTPTAPTANTGANTTQIASTAFVSGAVSDLINSAPALLDTLAELATAINNDESFATTIANSIATKVALAGDTMTGFLTLSADPTNNLHAVTKQYVDNEINAQMIYSTDDVPEGSLNLYYTDARVRSAWSLQSDNTTVLSYDNTTGVLTYNHPNSDGILEGNTNLYYTDARVRNAISLTSDDNQILGYSSSTGAFTWTTPNTDKIVEGSTNQYFLTSRARASVSNGSNIDYDSATGIISTQAAVWSVNGQTHDAVLDTDDINEGSANLYFTNTRARSAVSLTTDDSNILSYNSGTGTLTFVTPSTDAIAEGNTNLYYTDARVRAAVSASGDISYNSATGNFSYSTPTTDGVNEGSNNLYFTEGRARNSISLTTDNSDVLSYDNTTGVITFSLGSQTTDDIQEGVTNLYFTDARARSAVSLTSDWDIVSYNSSTGVFSVALPNTDDVNEGSTNQYFTTTRARDSVSATHSSGDGDLTYNSLTGVFDYAGPTNADYRQAVSAVKDSGHGDLQYNSTTGVFTYTGPSNATYRAGFSAVDNGGDGSFSYDSATGVFTYTGPDDSEVRAHFSATTATGAQYDSATGVFSLANVPNSSLTNSSVTVNGAEVSLGGSTSFGTDSVSEETNLYFTDARARSAVSLTSDNTSVLDYNSTTGVFTFSLGSQTTDDVAEGSTNLYFTNARARSAVSATDAGGDGSFSYDSATGVFTYTGPNDSEVRAHFSATTNTGVTYDSSTGVIALSGIPNSSLTNSSVTVNGRTVSLGGSGSFDTDSVNEGPTNLYYTGARVRNELSATDSESSGSFSYDSTTGTFTFDATGVVAEVNGQKGYVTLDTDDISEGVNNLYFTTTRARDSVSGGTGVTYTAGTGVIAIGQAVGTTDNVTFNDVTVSGDLTVQGTLTTINSTTVDIADLNLTVAKGAANATAANGAGLTVDGANATITYASATDSWNFNKDVSVTGGLSITGDLSATTFIGDLTGDVTGTVSDLSNHTTDDVAEGLTNLYFTDTRARSAVSLTSDKTSVLDYNSSTGAFTFNLASASTSDIAEGTNLYFTNDRARGALSITDNGGDGSLSYNSSTGTIEYTGPSASETRAHFSATTNTGVTYDSSTGTFALASIPNSSLTNSSVTVNGAEVSLGGSTSFGTDSVTEETNLYFTNARARSAVSLTSDNTSVLDYNSTTGEFTFNLGNQTTDDVTEGVNNLYFTQARARSSVSIVDAGGDGSFAYDSSTGVFTYTGPNDSEVRAHFSATKTGGDGNFSYDSATGTFSYTGPDQDNYRVAISASNVSGDGSISYDDTTGIISYTGPSASETRAHFSATTNTGVTYDSATGVIALSGIPNSSLTNNSVTINGTTVALGASASFGTDSVTEEGNLYFTDARARSAISLTTSDATVFSYDSATGAFTYNAAGLDTDEVTEGTTNLYFTQARARASISASGWSNLSYNDSTGVISISNPSTADVTEDVSNKYFTDARARQAVSLTTDNTDAMSYDNTTGVFTFTLNSVDTDEIAEGATNLYFTTARARNTVNNGANIDYDATTGTISTQAAVWTVNGQNHDVVLNTDDVSEGSTNLYFTDARARSAITLTTDDTNILNYSSGTGEFTFVTPTTDSIDEGAVNLYYTDARADARIAAASVFDLSDVDTGGNALSDGYTLVWSSASQQFVPQNVAVTATTLNFTGDGTTTSFNTEVEVSSIDNTSVYINGLIQAPTYSYTLSTSNGQTSIVFDQAPESNDYIFIRVSATSSLTAGGVLNEASTIDGGSF